ncbi:universal stress protein g [Citrobacter koseri]|uniref:Universal stress protein g n=1 Tax=Citrobacter koseri TaxID=545 RepID=A0A447UPD8_CITKO|nr:universal stress protein g [Citrobacter koseri]
MNKVILMPVDILAMDLSDKAIAYADHMVDKENGVIHLLHVFPKTGYLPNAWFCLGYQKIRGIHDE